MTLINKNTIFRFIRFGLVGVLNTLIDLGVLNLLIFIFGISNPFMFSIYKGISFLCALVNSYFMNKRFTFGNKSSGRRTFYLFIFFSLMGFVVNVTVSTLAFYGLSFYTSTLSVASMATISGLIGTVLGLFVNYITYSYFVFK